VLGEVKGGIERLRSKVEEGWREAEGTQWRI